MRTLKLALIALVVAASATPAVAQVPKDRQGHPDLAGVWTNANLTPLQRPAGQDKLVVSAAEAKKITAYPVVAGVKKTDADFSGYVDPTKGAPEKGGRDFGLKGYDFLWVTPGDNLTFVNGEFHTSGVVDPPNGQVPYTEAALPARRAQSQRGGEGSRDFRSNLDYPGPESTALSERCLIGFSNAGGPGMLAPIYNNNYQFVVTASYVMILVEMPHDARIAPIFATAEEARKHHKPATITPWLGDSVAWWEGDTLAVETTNVNPKQAQQSSFRLSPKGVVTERFRRTGEKEIDYTFTVNDPDTYTQVWKAEYGLHPNSRLYEYACHEGNYGLHGILAGARMREEREAAEATKAKPVKAKATKAGQ